MTTLDITGFENLKTELDLAYIKRTNKIRQLPIKGKIRIHRNTDGEVFLLGVAAAAVLNRVNEIDSTKLFDNFILRAKKENSYPDLLFYHVNNEFFRIGKIIKNDRIDYTYIIAAKFDLNQVMARIILNGIEQDPEYWGMSIGYMPHGNPKLIRVGESFVAVYDDGFNHEVSILPEAQAASFFTNIDLVKGVY